MRQVLLVALSVAGMGVSLPFLLIQSGLIGASSRFLPPFCRLDDRTCGRVLSHPDARLMGIPNYVPGILYYISVLAMALGITYPFYQKFIVVTSWVTVAVACYLVYSLYFKVKATCWLCIAAHIVNILLLVTLTFW